MRHAYFIGEGLAERRWGKFKPPPLPSATGWRARRHRTFLPGVKDAQIAALSNAVTQYAANVTAPGDQQNENSSALQAIIANIGTLAGLRQQVQLAAEQAFPWRTPGVAGIRKSFQLPTDRPMRG